MERERLDRERIEREKQQRMERERLEREKMERGRKERERLEQELKDKENRLLGKNRLKLFENDGERSPFSRDKGAYGNKAYLPQYPYTPGPDILSRNKPEVYGQAPITPNPERNQLGLFRRDDLKRNEVKPVLYAAPVKEIINEAKRDVSPLRFVPARKVPENDSGSGINNSNQKAEKNLNENNENALNVLRVEESRSDKSERKVTPTPKDGPILSRNKPESSGFKAIAQKEAREMQKKKEQQQGKESARGDSSRGNESERSEKGEKARVNDMRSKLDEERKKMREDIMMKKVRF